MRSRSQVVKPGFAEPTMQPAQTPIEPALLNAQQPEPPPVVPPSHTVEAYNSDLQKRADEMASLLAQNKAQNKAPKSGADNAVGATYDGASVTVTIGKTNLCPVKYNGFDVGPLSMTVKVGRTETPVEAYQRARLVLTELYEAEFSLRLQDFKRHLEAARVAT